MIPRQALAALDAEVPRLNPILAKGLAVTHLTEAEHYLNQVIRTVASDFPPGLEYKGCRRCTPQEEYAEATKPKNNRSTYDVARSDVYMMRYEFSYNGEPLKPKFMYLPFVGQAATIFLSGSRYVISPILADRVISVQMHTIFVRLLKAKLTVNRVQHPYRIGSNDQLENVQVAWARIHHSKQRPPSRAVTAECTLVHYLLCKYGFSGMFEKFLGTIPIVGTDATITPENYPVKDWVICYASGSIPKGIRGTYRASYEKSPIRLAIKRSHYDANARNLIAGFFYVVDHFPQRVKPEYVDDVRLWQVLLGYAIYAATGSEGKLINDVQDHMTSLDEYVDAITQKMLQQIHYPAADVYELFFLIIKNFNDWILTADDRVSTMYDKELAILQFVFKNMIENVNNFYFKLNAAKKKDLQKNKIEDLLAKYFRLGGVYSLAKDNGAVSTQPTSGDNMALKITNIQVPQSQSNKGTGQKRQVIGDPAKRLHGSIAEVGGYINLPKSHPDGRSRLNLCLQIDETGMVMRNPAFVELIDGVQAKIKRHRNT